MSLSCLGEGGGGRCNYCENGKWTRTDFNHLLLLESLLPGSRPNGYLVRTCKFLAETYKAMHRLASFSSKKLASSNKLIIRLASSYKLAIRLTSSYRLTIRLTSSYKSTISLASSYRLTIFCKKLASSYKLTIRSRPGCACGYKLWFFVLTRQAILRFWITRSHNSKPKYILLTRHSCVWTLFQIMKFKCTKFRCAFGDGLIRCHFSLDTSTWEVRNIRTPQSRENYHL